MSAQHTSGPWFWHWDGQCRPSLRTPDRGQLIVMDFGRKGMQGATPRFAHWTGMMGGSPRDRTGGVLVDWAEFHGKYGMHPDARLIAAAPALLAALNAMLTHMGMDEDEWNKPTFDQARRAIAAAKGEA